MKNNDSRIFRIGVEDWINIQKELNDYTKRGNLIVSPSKIF